jgi:TRAP-type uncharacterized transport system substrate-binding protein
MSTILELLKGKKMKIMTDMKVEVILEIKNVEQNNHSREIGESNAANDWWPETIDWTTYTVTFINGATKQFDDINQINII